MNYINEQIDFSGMAFSDRVDLADNIKRDPWGVALKGWHAPTSLSELCIFDDNNGTLLNNNSGAFYAVTDHISLVDSFDVGTFTFSVDTAPQVKEDMDLLKRYSLIERAAGHVEVELKRSNGETLPSGVLTDDDIAYNFPVLEILATLPGKLRIDMSKFSLDLDFGQLDEADFKQLKVLFEVFGSQIVMSGCDFQISSAMLSYPDFLQEARTLMGKEFLHIAAAMIEAIEIDEGNFDQTVEQAIDLWNYRPSNYEYGNVGDDVQQTFRLLAQFLVYKTLESELNADLIEDAYDRFAQEGLVDKEDSGLQKLWQRSTGGGITYVREKVGAMVSQPFHKELTGDIQRTPSPNQPSGKGFSMYDITSPQSSVATLIMGNPRYGATVGLAYSEEKGVTQSHIDSISSRKRGHTVWQSVAPYTSGSKATGLLIGNGRIESDLIQLERLDAIVIIYPANSPLFKRSPLRIVDKNNLTAGDITGELSDTTPLDIRRPTDFIRLLTLAEDSGISLFQQHLLLQDGKSQIASETGHSDKRRALLTFPDGSFGLLSFAQENNYTFSDMVYIAQQLGATSMANCDTGYYDIASVDLRGGESMKLGGDSRSDITYNAVIGISTAKP